MQSPCVVRRTHTWSKSCAHRVLGMPRREALGDVRADEAGATGEKDAHAGGRASRSSASRFSEIISTTCSRIPRAPRGRSMTTLTRSRRDASPIGAARTQKTNVGSASGKTDLNHISYFHRFHTSLNMMMRDDFDHHRGTPAAQESKFSKFPGLCGFDPLEISDSFPTEARFFTRHQ